MTYETKKFKIGSYDAMYGIHGFRTYFYLWYGRKCVEHFAARPKDFRTGC